MSTNQQTGCISGVFAILMFLSGILIILISILNNEVGTLALFVGLNSIGIGVVLLSLYRLQNPRITGQNTTGFKVVGNFESPAEANMAAMYLRSHDVVAIVTNTDDQALPGMTSSRGIYIKVPLDQEEIATELLDAEPYDDN
jgi:hypothetical protein